MYDFAHPASPASLPRSLSMFRKAFGPLLAFALVVAVSAAPQTQSVPAEKIDNAMIAKIKAEGMERSQIMRIEHMLTDIYGPRLTGSPNHKAAGEWAIKEMTSGGMKNGPLEPFEWQAKEGWLSERAYGFVTAPYKSNLVFAVQPWTPSTNGTVRAQAVNIIPPNGAVRTFNPNTPCGG